jgi:hypothetical protein
MAKCPFDFKRLCPENDGPDGCKGWWEILHTHQASQEQKIVKACFLAPEMLPTMLIQVIAASNRPAAAAESLRNEIMTGFGLLAEAMMEDRPHGHLPQGPNRRRQKRVAWVKDAKEVPAAEPQ